MRRGEIPLGDDLAAHFAACSAETRFEDLPAGAVAAAFQPGLSQTRNEVC